MNHSDIFLKFKRQIRQIKVDINHPKSSGIQFRMKEKLEAIKESVLKSRGLKKSEKKSLQQSCMAITSHVGMPQTRPIAEKQNVSNPVKKINSERIVSAAYLRIKNGIQNGGYNREKVLAEIQKIESKNERIKLNGLFNENEFHAEILDWEMLPAGQRLSDFLHRRYADSPENVPYIDLARFRLIESLHPIKIFIGKGSFQKYYAFLFAFTPYVILECPIFGNALYVIKKNWIELSKMTKAELLKYHHDSIIKIIHREEITSSKLREILLSGTLPRSSNKRSIAT